MMDGLISRVGADCALPAPQDAVELCEAIKRRGEAAAILYYGSGLWKDVDENTVHDFYVLADRFTDFDDNAVHGALGAWLPPNVYYVELPAGRRILRCKFALMRIDQFERAAKGLAVTPQIWARFAQPCRLLHARSGEDRDRVLGALAQCVMTFHRRSLPLVAADADARQVWLRGLGETYGAELRSEQPERTRDMVDAMKDSLLERTSLALPLLTVVRRDSKPAIFTGWALRPLLKLVALVRLMKATVTFEGAVDYALYKIERQSGLRFEATDFQKRYPLISAWPLLWKIYRKGGLR